jgi:hypothetical protein
MSVSRWPVDVSSKDKTAAAFRHRRLTLPSTAQVKRQITAGAQL